MINPIQQNVVFKGAKAQTSDNFTGAPAVSTNVRQDYLNAVHDVSAMQQKMNTQVDSSLGKKLDVIA